MEKVRILGIDPSLRNTGLAIVTYDTEKRSFHTSDCQVLVNPKKYTGTEAILNMLEMIMDTAKQPCYQNLNAILVESPSVMFNKNWAGGTISSLAHISGGAAVAFGLETVHLFRPNEWNRTRKKEVTHERTMNVLGSSDKWHYTKRIKSEKLMEHILDAASMALWWVQSNYEE